jgi:hypothetical protein
MIYEVIQAGDVHPLIQALTKHKPNSEILNALEDEGYAPIYRVAIERLNGNKFPFKILMPKCEICGKCSNVLVRACENRYAAIIGKGRIRPVSPVGKAIARLVARGRL